MIKFQKPLSEIDYIISFDLALYKTGVSIYDISQKSIVRTDKIEVSHTDENARRDALYEAQRVPYLGSREIRQFADDRQRGDARASRSIYDHRDAPNAREGARGSRHRGCKGGWG